MSSKIEIEQNLEDFKKDVTNKFDIILDAVEKITKVQQISSATSNSNAFRVTKPEVVVSPITESKASSEASNYVLNPAYQAIFDEYFDPADGFTGRLHGVYFTIIVPMKFSNAIDAWKSLYKEDTRQKVLHHDRIEDDMREWCNMVAHNLKYNKKIKLK